MLKTKTPPHKGGVFAFRGSNSWPSRLSHCNASRFSTLNRAVKASRGIAEQPNGRTAEQRNSGTAEQRGTRGKIAAKRQTPNAKRQTPNAKRQTPKAKRQKPNAKRQTLSHRSTEALPTQQHRIITWPPFSQTN
jgi:hypothetical protein